MASILMVYKSRTGFTKKYADWIADSIVCQTIPFDQLNDADMHNHDIIVYGAGIHAGRIQGLKAFKHGISGLANKQIVVFATGGAPHTHEIVSKIKSDNFTADELDKINFFYFQSGLNYEKMNFVDSTLMKVYKKILDSKNNRSSIEDGTSKTILKSYDNSRIENINPLIDHLKDSLDERS